MHHADISSDELLELSLRRIEELENLLSSQQKNVVITGVSCYLPGEVKSLDDLHAFLMSGKSSIGDIPSERWNVQDFFHPDPQHKGTYYTKAGTFIEDPFGFDQTAFHISHKEAREIDPQHRLLYHMVHELLMDAGLSIDALKGEKVGLFMGTGEVDYSTYTTHSASFDRITSLSKLGATRSIGVGRIAHFFDFKGPALFVDTSCSTSLVALREYFLNCVSFDRSDKG